jgi:arylsulfatase
VLTALLALTAAGPVAAAPNIVVILSDDMGFSDLDGYGGEIRTANLDALAAKGLRFTRLLTRGAHATPLAAPVRSICARSTL